ncbi:MAG: hypothetical protein R3F49_07120 [Planctomycetota bacterium]
MTPSSHHPPAPDVQLVGSFEELLTTPFEGACNALCWERALAGDFEEVVRLLEPGDGVTCVDEAELEALHVSAAGARAVAVLREDLRRLREAGHAPELNCIEQYPRDHGALVPTDVYSFHVDSATVPTVTILCCYVGPASEGLPRAQARRRVDDPGLRAALRAAFVGDGPSRGERARAGDPDEAFDAYLREQHLDLHYAPLPHARPYSFGVGHMWRLAVQYPGSPTPACIHRAPTTPACAPRRLLLIS